MNKIVSLQKLYYKWWKNIDKFLLTLIILLFLVGLFFSLVSTSLIASDKLNTNDYSFFFKHLIFIIYLYPKPLIEHHSTPFIIFHFNYLNLIYILL